MTHEINVSVRYCETDAGGHVNNTSYFIYLEEARTKFFQTLGYGMGNTYPSVGFILASTKCDFLDQAYFNQNLLITTDVAAVGMKSFKLVHQIREEQSRKPIAQAEAVIVCFNYETQQSRPIPEELKAELESRLAAH
ncbi:MAG: acyl-CoA thioesterase [Bacillaceae bacterium]|nr:acyl-CoA thioesterase [Bacillaceae bacterium]